MGGACGQGKAVQDSETGSLGGLQACEGQPGSGWSGWTVDCGVRGQPFGQPLQALEPAVVRELLPSAGAAGRHSKGEWWDTTVGRSDGCRPNRSGRRPTLSGADCGAGVSPRLLRLPTRQVCDRCRAHGSGALLAPRLGARSRHQGFLRQHRLGVDAQSRPPTYGLPVGAALHRALVEGASADGGR